VDFVWWVGAFVVVVIAGLLFSNGLLLVRVTAAVGEGEAAEQTGCDAEDWERGLHGLSSLQ